MAPSKPAPVGQVPWLSGTTEFGLPFNRKNPNPNNGGPNNHAASRSLDQSQHQGLQYQAQPLVGKADQRLAAENFVKPSNATKLHFREEEPYFHHHRARQAHVETANSQKKKKVVATKQANKRAPKEPNTLKKPMSAFLAFSNTRKAALKQQHPHMTNADLSKLLSVVWKEAPEEMKQKYKDEFESQMKEWRVKKKAAEAKEAEGLPSSGSSGEPAMRGVPHQNLTPNVAMPVAHVVSHEWPETQGEELARKKESQQVNSRDRQQNRMPSMEELEQELARKEDKIAWLQMELAETEMELAETKQLHGLELTQLQNHYEQQLSDLKQYYGAPPAPAMKQAGYEEDLSAAINSGLHTPPGVARAIAQKRPEVRPATKVKPERSGETAEKSMFASQVPAFLPPYGSATHVAAPVKRSGELNPTAAAGQVNGGKVPPPRVIDPAQKIVSPLPIFPGSTAVVSAGHRPAVPGDQHGSLLSPAHGTRPERKEAASVPTDGAKHLPSFHADHSVAFLSLATGDIPIPLERSQGVSSQVRYEEEEIPLDPRYPCQSTDKEGKSWTIYALKDGNLRYVLDEDGRGFTAKPPKTAAECCGSCMNNKNPCRHHKCSPLGLSNSKLAKSSVSSK